MESMEPKIILAHAHSEQCRFSKLRFQGLIITNAIFWEQRFSYPIFTKLSNIPNESIYRERVNNLEKFDDLDFFDRFRITKPTFHLLLETIEHLIETPTNRGGSIKPMNQVLLTLRFYALGCMQKAVADFTGVSTPSACRIISKVSNAIASLHRQHIKML
ncbi:hypothetical protein JTB14_020555 [Gonioctena quinquepunctata]|nr:hypothetical protein JTB14_020555 [Gonioctena quinquepunctata]